MRLLMFYSLDEKPISSIRHDSKRGVLTYALRACPVDGLPARCRKCCGSRAGIFYYELIPYAPYSGWKGDRRASRSYFKKRVAITYISYGICYKRRICRRRSIFKC
jgi:hypothetical protein